jgi:hypothetical protein
MPAGSTPSTFGTLGGAPGDNAALAAALAGAGGFIDTDVAYLDSTGNDTTGDGSPGNPWLTAQKAVDEGFTIIRGGVGNFGNISSSSALNITLIGLGRYNTVFGTISAPSGSVTGNGMDMLTVGAITFTATPNGTTGATGEEGGGPGGDGQSAANATSSQCSHLTSSGDITLVGAVGGAGGTGGGGTNGGVGGNGSGGGDGATLSLTNCRYQSAISASGNGGAGGTGGDGSDGNGGNGGNGGQGGSGGALEIVGCIELVGHSTPAGDGGGAGTGGGGSVGNGAEGTAGSAGNNGTTLITHFSSVITGTVTTDTVVASMVDGAFVASA